jgi:hypothetical protein
VGQAHSRTRHPGPLLMMNCDRICFIRQLARHHLPSLTSPTPIIAIATHPGAVSTVRPLFPFHVHPLMSLQEQQKGATEAYGTILGKTLETAASYLFMSPEQGAESALWAGTAPSVGERREEVQGRYFTEADGKVCRCTCNVRSKLICIVRSTPRVIKPRMTSLRRTSGT